MSLKAVQRQIQCFWMPNVLRGEEKEEEKCVTATVLMVRCINVLRMLVNLPALFNG